MLIIFAIIKAVRAIESQFLIAHLENDFEALLGQLQPTKGLFNIVNMGRKSCRAPALIINLLENIGRIRPKTNWPFEFLSAIT